ncbi:MAG: hypothetical protein FWD66_11505 [Paludibacter sp.]|nr:hypothetical protein [Paludibacter sp.]
MLRNKGRKKIEKIKMNFDNINNVINKQKFIVFLRIFMALEAMREQRSTLTVKKKK